jgi:hypothetical protein
VDDLAGEPRVLRDEAICCDRYRQKESGALRAERMLEVTLGGRFERERDPLDLAVEPGLAHRERKGSVDFLAMLGHPDPPPRYE